MIITWDVCGFYDWEDARKLGVTVTEDDVKYGRAKPLMSGSYGVKIVKEMDTHHQQCIPELVLCMMIAQRAAAGKLTTRDEAVGERIREQTFREHIAKKHVKSVHVHDDGPDEALMKWALAQVPKTPQRIPDDVVLEGYLENVDMSASVAGQFGPQAKKAVK